MAFSVAQTQREGIDRSKQRFREGISHLARALHPIEDSYAPAHTSRNRKTGEIDFIFYWGDKSELKSHGLNATHGQLDDPKYPYSQEYFDAARDSTGEIILILLEDLDKDEELLFERPSSLHVEELQVGEHSSSQPLMQANYKLGQRMQVLDRRFPTVKYP